MGSFHGADMQTIIIPSRQVKVKHFLDEFLKQFGLYGEIVDKNAAP
jgi:hypothetical protein